MKAAIYSRVSTEDQDFSKQTNELKDYTKKENIEVVLDNCPQKYP